MADINYPCDMPRPLIQGYGYAENSKVRRNDVQVGAPRYELLSETAPCMFNVVFSFNAFQFRVFEAWYKATTVFGSKLFDITLSVGAGDKVHECYFDGVYRSTLNGTRWRVSATLLGIEKQYDTDECEIEEMLFIANYGGLSSYIKSVNNMCDVTIPTYLGNLDYGTGS